MQFTAVWIKEYLPTGMSLNDICCYIPAWFGIAATLITGLIAYECSVPANSSSNLLQFALDILAGKKSPVDPSKFPDRNLLIGLVWSPAVWCGVASAAFMSIVPAHLMRSMGGGYDNESVAITAMVLTFYYWVRSLRATDHYSHWWGIATGLAYFYMVAAWGGYVFVINLIGVHAAVLVGLGRFNYKIYMAYSLFYVIGTALAIQVPVVGWTPLKSLEQLGPCVVFLGYQALMFCEVIRNRQNLSRREAWMLRIKVAGVTAGVLLGITFMLAPTGYFGPISSRVRGLFVKHTKTGNPLVDSVAEHQPASSRAYFQYLHHVCSLAPVGYMIVMFKLSDSSSFLIVWGSAAYFFSHKMVRLVLLTAPIGSVLGGIAAGRVFAWCVHQWWESQEQESSLSEEVEDEMKEDTSTGGKKSKASKARKAAKKTAAPAKANSSFQGLVALQEAADKFGKSKEGIMAKRTLAAVGLLLGYMLGTSFVSYSWRLSKDLSNPTIIQKARRRDGTIIQLDDYREAYWWLRDNTPEDARVMAWWDCKYQRRI
jgi:dolichyl-diphosphooligosaccharide--protein glycosyltransferase